ncbi:hypothetical protein Cadr_000022406 [Camelus dromedarius]|uniref:Uncharacterized protein n=1 Tax=Camelus dromedarius TaxID=9838 RepID=A0A5N4CSC3_CAMDR|nr:hypothetical protein Cadr_000022406 [Camelus dromedarius]
MLLIPGPKRPKRGCSFHLVSWILALEAFCWQVSKEVQPGLCGETVERVPRCYPTPAPTPTPRHCLTASSGETETRITHPALPGLIQGRLPVGSGFIRGPEVRQTEAGGRKGKSDVGRVCLCEGPEAERTWGGLRN